MHPPVRKTRQTYIQLHKILPQHILRNKNTLETPPHTPSKHQRNKRTHPLNTSSIRKTCTPQRIQKRKETRNHQENTQPLHVPPQNDGKKNKHSHLPPANINSSYKMGGHTN